MRAVARTPLPRAGETRRYGRSLRPPRIRDGRPRSMLSRSDGRARAVVRRALRASVIRRMPDTATSRTDEVADRSGTGRIALARVYVRRLRAQPVSETARKLLNPGVVRSHARRLLRPSIPIEHSNEYRASNSRVSELEFCAALLRDASRVEDAYDELESDDLVLELRRSYVEKRPSTASFELGRFRIWYAVVRCLRPEVVLETGVHDGLSSAVILQALERNGMGRLVSIDLPSTDLPPTADGPGWLVPKRLRARWTLHVGDARRLLPGVARDLSAIDVFSHDSDHSADH